MPKIDLSEAIQLGDVEYFKNMPEEEIELFPSLVLDTAFELLEYSHVEAFKILLERASFDVNAVNMYGATFLHLAAEAGYVDVVQLLLEKGADVSAKDACDNTPLHRAAGCGFMEISKKGDVHSFSYIFGVVNEVPTTEKIKNIIVIINLLVQNGAPLEALNIGDSTALHHASKRKHIEVVKFLLESGAALYVRDGLDRTPLDCATQFGCAENQKLLQEWQGKVRCTTTAMKKTEDNDLPQSEMKDFNFEPLPDLPPLPELPHEPGPVRRRIDPNTIWAFIGLITFTVFIFALPTMIEFLATYFILTAAAAIISLKAFSWMRDRYADNLLLKAKNEHLISPEGERDYITDIHDKALFEKGKRAESNWNDYLYDIYDAPNTFLIKSKEAEMYQLGRAAQKAITSSQRNRLRA